MNFFITRPIFASAIALLMVLMGGIAMLALPVSQYPPMVPPQVQITTRYIGADANVVDKAVTTPLEEKLNGASGMIYMSSSSTDNGDSIIEMTFDVGFDQNVGQLEALVRSNQAEATLPPEVTQIGLSIEKFSSNRLLSVNLVSPNGTYDGLFLQNYAFIHIVDALARIPGIAKVNNQGGSRYAMRIWLDADKLSNLGLTAVDVANAIREQNTQVAAGKIGQQPAPQGQAFQFQLNSLGRLEHVEQFEDIILRALDNGSVVRIRDVARVELGSEVYDWVTKASGEPTAFLIIMQLPNANGLEIKAAVVKTMNRLAREFPDDLTWTIQYDTTIFIEASAREVVITLFQAIGLVILVVFLFLQSWRSTIIPIIAVPVSLIGTFAFMLAFGFTINLLTLLGLVLAVALVVDDAIVVVEIVSRKLEESERDLKEVTREALAEVRGPIIATTLVVIAVFVPMAFIPGMTGLLYNQFALTIAIAVGLSSINSLTLSPALCAVLLRRKSSKKNVFFRTFDRGFEALNDGYANCVKFLSNIWLLVLLSFAGLCFLTIYLFDAVPKGFLPEEDQGYLMIMVQLPEGASVERTESVLDQATQMARDTPGVALTMEVAGYNIVDQFKQPDAGYSMVVLKPFEERNTPDAQLKVILNSLRAKVARIPEARVMVMNAPAIPGLGSTAGFNFQILDMNGQGVAALSEVARNFLEAARQRPELAGVNTTFNSQVPKRYLDVDRTKVKTNQVSIGDVFDTLQINLGSMYVNVFNKFGRIYRVYLQAEVDARDELSDIGRLRVRNKDGDMIPLEALLTVVPIVGPYNIPHYNSYRSVPIRGRSAPGYSSGDAIKAMEELAETTLPDGFGFEWSGITYQQLKAGNLAPIAFGLSIVIVFLVLAALYESWVLPLIILLSIPLGLLGAFGALYIRGMELNIYGQIGLVMLIALVAKNAILIVEFAKELRGQGLSIMEAAVTASRLRLRPIFMTSFAFVVGLMPLVVAVGPGSESRQSVGTVVVGGLAFATVTIVFVPIIYVIFERLIEGKAGRSTIATPLETAPQADD